MFKQINQLAKLPAGFTLIEVVIVTTIVVSAFIGILTIAANTIKFRSINQKALVAAQLAQEGVELVRYYRNDNWLHGQRFGLGINYSSAGNVTDNLTEIFAIDYANRSQGAYSNSINILPFYRTGDSTVNDNTLGCQNDFDACLKNDYANLYFDSNSNNFYSIISDQNLTQPISVPDGYTDSGFNRLIETIYHDGGTATDSDDYLQVICKVYWQDRGHDSVYTVSTNLYNYDWYH